jgi:hypothetical protein
MLLSSSKPPRWPMYIRQLKQFLRNVDASFDERKYGFESLGDLMRACQRDGLLRIERDRQGGMRIFPGNIAQPVQEPTEPLYEETAEVQEESAAPAETVEESWMPPSVEASADAEVVDGNVLQERDIPPIVDVDEAPPVERIEKPARRRKGGSPRTTRTGETRGRKSVEASGVAAAASRPRKTPSRSRGGKSRQRSDAPSE